MESVDNKINELKPNKKPLLLKISVIAITGFILVQSVFLASNVHYLNNYVDHIAEESVITYSIYNDYQKSLSLNSNQQEMIYQFGRLANRDSAADLLRAGIIILSLAQEKRIAKYGIHPMDKKFMEEYPKEAEEYRLKWTHETREFLSKSYLKNPKSGLDTDRDRFNKISCISIDISCKFIKNFFIEKNNKQVAYMEEKINQNIYYLQNIDKYVEYIDKTLNSIQQNTEIPKD